MKNKELSQKINRIVEELQMVTEKMGTVIKLLSEINDLSEDINYPKRSVEERFEKIYKAFFIGIFDDALYVNLKEICHDLEIKKRFLKAFDGVEKFNNTSTRDMLDGCDYWSGDWSSKDISKITKRLNRIKCKEKSQSIQ